MFSLNIMTGGGLPSKEDTGLSELKVCGLSISEREHSETVLLFDVENRGSSRAPVDLNERCSELQTRKWLN